MEIRAARLSDVGRMAEIAVKAFANEPIYAHFFPYQNVYPDDYQKSLARSYATSLNTPGEIAMVATVPDATGQAVVSGFATFIRHGLIPLHRRPRWNPDSISKKFFRVWLWITSFFEHDRSVDRASIKSYYDQAAAVKEHIADDAFIEFRTLAVDPEHQRKGFGERLVEWCGIRAVQDGLPVYGDATATALPLYVRNGCKDVGRIVLEEKLVKPKGVTETAVQKLDGLNVVVLRWDSSVLTELMKDHIDFTTEV